MRELYEALDERVMAGFGGVAEYGITVRWDKNFLKIVRLLLERRSGFALFGGIRFGGTLTVDEAFAMGFDHVALAVGAGHCFIIIMKDSYPINVLNAIKDVPEVCGIYCATANPVELVIAETETGRGILGVIDGSKPKGIEDDAGIKWRKDFLRKIGYKIS